VLLLDEPTSGLHPVMVEKLLGLIQQLADEGRTVIIIEHNLNLVRRISNCECHMAAGRCSKKEIPNDPKFLTAVPT
jgi:ABC-type histidine transport system ATPase subunit